MPRQNRAEVKKEIGDFIVGEILLSVSKEKSPVQNGEYKKGLSKEYRKFKGSNKADMELEGDLLDALEAKNRRGNQIEIGVFKKSERGKADGHNQIHEKHPHLPKRQFIPSEKEQFRKNIMNGVNRIIEDNKRQDAETRQDAEQPFIIPVDTQETGIDLDSILGRSFLDELFEG